MSPEERKITSTSTPRLKPLYSHEGKVSSTVKPAPSSAPSAGRASSGATNTSMSSVARGRESVAALTPPISR
jgi:hypothetical protein